MLSPDPSQKKTPITSNVEKKVLGAMPLPPTLLYNTPTHAYLFYIEVWVYILFFILI